MTAAPQRSLRLVSWKPLVKGSLRGFATIQLPIGLRFFDCPVLVSSGKAWAMLPSKPILNPEGRHSAPNRKPQYTPVAEWHDKAISQR